MLKAFSDFFRRPPPVPDTAHMESEIEGELAAQQARRQAINKRSEALSAKTDIVLGLCAMVIEEKRGRND